MGTVSIQVNASHPMSLEFAHAEIEQIIECIERQLEINSELSSIKRMSSEGRRGLQMLVKLDELDGKEDSGDYIPKLLELSAAHFDVEMAAVLLPEMGIKDTWPASLLTDDGTSKTVMATLGSLVTQAKMHRKVLLSDANITIQVAAGLGSRSPKVLCCPIMNSKDEVIGIFVLMGPRRFTRDHVRLARAISVKIYSFSKTARQSPKEKYTRHTLLHYVDKSLVFDPGQSHALLHIDIDKLHIVNDNYGHVAGDVVIDHVGDVIAGFAKKDDAVAPTKVLPWIGHSSLSTHSPGSTLASRPWTLKSPPASASSSCPESLRTAPPR